MPVIGRDVGRRGSPACPERTRSDTIVMKASVDQRRESVGGIRNAGAADGGEHVRAAVPRCCSKETLKAKLLVGMFSEERGGRMRQR